MNTFKASPILALLACAACGSSSSSGLYSGHGGPDAGAHAGGSGGLQGGSGTTPGVGGSTGFAGMSSSGSAAGALSIPDASLGSGGNADAAGPPLEGGGSSNMPTPGTIFCDGMQCTIAGVPTSACCVGVPPFPTSCLPTFPGCGISAAIAIACDDASDCPNGQVCCGNLSGQNTGTQCAATCPSPSIQVCRTDAECRMGRCRPIPQAPDYGGCQ